MADATVATNTSKESARADGEGANLVGGGAADV